MATVSNPYTFTITANKTVSASISASAPVVLSNGTLNSWSMNGHPNHVDFTIPSGYNKVRIIIEDETFIITVTAKKSYTLLAWDEVIDEVWGKSGVMLQKTDNNRDFIDLVDIGYYDESPIVVVDYEITYGPQIEAMASNYSLLY